MLESARSDTASVVTRIVCGLLARQGFDTSIEPTDSLAERGLSSADMVSLMLTVEDEFNIRIPDREMRPANFRSVSRIDALVRALLANADARA